MTYIWFHGVLITMPKYNKKIDDRGFAGILFLIIGAILISGVVIFTNPSLKYKFINFLHLKNVLSATYPPDNTSEPELGTLAGPAFQGTDVNASGGRYVQLGAPEVVVQNFQPHAPYHAAFTYLFYENPATDGAYTFWQNNSNNPPKTWSSHFLPDVDSSVFNPTNELYSNNDYNAFKWQVAKLAEAKQEVSIVSWHGQGFSGDQHLDKAINTFMAKSDNPYPNLRWSIHYEPEDGTPSVDTLVDDLTYIKSKYGDSPYYFKINNKPVIFVHGASETASTNTNCNDTSDTSVTHRWYQANSRMNNAFYIVLQVFTNYTTVPCQPNSWHQFAPTTRQGQHGNYSYYVSPGFWQDSSTTEKLVRDSANFEAAVRSMVSANTTWKLTETWDKWPDGNQVAPGQKVRFNSSTGSEELDTNASTSYNYKNLYVNILNRNLPALEAGTGR